MSEQGWDLHVFPGQGQGLGFSLSVGRSPPTGGMFPEGRRINFTFILLENIRKIRAATTANVQFPRKIRHATTANVQFYRKIRVFGGSADSFRDPGGPRTPPEGLGGPLCSDSVSKQCLGGHYVAILCQNKAREAWGGCYVAILCPSSAWETIM